MKTKSGPAFVAAITLTLLSACASQERPAAASPADFIVQTINDGTAVKITGFTGGATDVRIPPRLEGLPVTAIGPSAFVRRNLTSVSIPNTVTHIGANAFWNNRLGEVRIPPSVVYIGSSAFALNHIERVSVPLGAYVGASAFDARVLVE